MVRLLIAASGTGGHLFPALALAENLPDYDIQWLGVPNRLEQTLVGDRYPLHTVAVEGFQGSSPVKNLQIFLGLVGAVFKVRQLIKEQQIDLVFTTGGYIASPAILAARLQGIPAIIHESNYIPGKVTKLLSRFCDTVALGFAGTAQYLPQARTQWVSTPVRSQFYTPQPLDLPIPENVPLIVVVGGSQGAVSVNQLVTLPFYDNMAGLLQRANLAVSRAGAGTLTELAITQTPAILIPYPFAAEDHQTYNGRVFAEAGAAYLYPQKDLTPKVLEEVVINLLKNPDQLQQMAQKTKELAVIDSAQKLAELVMNYEL